MFNDHVTKWLQQFPATQRKPLLDLLYALNGASIIDMQDDIANHIQGFLDEYDGQKKQIMVESIISEEDIVCGSSPGHYPRVRGDFYYNYRAYVDYYPEKQRSKQSGSELYSDLTGRVLSKYIRSNSDAKRRFKIIKPTLDNLRKQTPLTIFLLTDNIGSGRQALTFLYSILHGLTFYIDKSKPVEVHIASWCATRGAVSSLREEFIEILKHKKYEPFNISLKLTFLNYSRTLEDINDPERRERIRDILKSISRPSKRGGAISYDNQNTLTVIEGHQCSNTTPYVFYDELVVKHPLFPNRLIKKGTLAWLNRQAAKREAEVLIRNSVEIRANNNHYRLAWLSSNYYREIFWLRMIYAALSYNREEALAMIQSDYLTLYSAEKELIARGYMEDDGRATPSGEAALRDYGRRTRFRLMKDLGHSSTKIFDATKNTYYPRSIDGVS